MAATDHSQSDSVTNTIDPDIATVDFEVLYPVDGPYAPGQIVEFRLMAQSPPPNIFPLVNPTVVTLLPPEVSYLGNVSTGSNIGQTVSLPNVVATPNWDGTGRTLLKFEWTPGNPLTLTPSTEWVEANIYFDVQVKSSVATGTYPFATSGWLESPAFDCQHDRGLVDTNDFDQDTDRTEGLCGEEDDFEVFNGGAGSGGNLGNFYVREDDNSIYAIDLVAGATSVVGTTTNTWNMNALALDPNHGVAGTLWYTDQSSYNLYQFDIDSGTETGLIGNIGAAGGSWTDPVNSAVLSGAWYDNAYYVGTSFNDDLYRVTFNASKTAIADVIKVADLKSDAGFHSWGDFTITSGGVLYGADNGTIFSYDLGSSGPVAHHRFGNASHRTDL